MTISLELLAPAKTADVGMAAIDHGADAVYIGAPQFSARSSAGNALPDIKRLVRHAHIYYAKVYVTLNTILTDAELPKARDLIHAVYDLGVDGVIIQDVGLLEIDLPPIPIIASTQMHNDTPEKVRFLEDVGFSRVILARELTLSEIAEIRRETTVELESFVHGALCVSYSGQCYMSQAVVGRSGNRGVCAQPCRSRYSLIDGDGKTVIDRKFLLSLKDLNLSEHIADLVDAGITSFKIEGRLKELDYVKNVVAAYRAAIDSYIEPHPTFGRASSGQVAVDFSPDLSRTFNRGYTNYFIGGRKADIASLDTRKSIGQPVGEVIFAGKDHFRLSGASLENGDGLCFFNQKQDLMGLRVERVKGDRIYPSAMKGLRAGTRLFRNHDQEFLRTLKKKTARRQIALDIRFEQDAEGIQITAEDEDGIVSRYAEQVAFAKAEQPERMKAKIVEHLSRAGDTPYTVKGIAFETTVPGFIPLSVLNDMRRKLLDHHTNCRLNDRPLLSMGRPSNTVPYPVPVLTHKANVLNDQARQFYRRHGVERIEPAFETLTDVFGKTVMTTRYCIRYQLNACLKDADSEHRLKAPLRIDDGLHRYRLEFDCAQCHMRVVLEGRSKTPEPEKR